MERQYIAIVPAYEPEEILLEVLAGLNRQGMKVILVNDGSGTEFSKIFARAESFAKVLSYSVNRGKGTALKMGMIYIQKMCAANSVVVTVDADGQHRPEDAFRLCQKAEENPTMLILGSRRLKENVPLRSQFGNTVTRFVYRLSTGQKVYDTQTGLRAFSSELITPLLSVTGSRYEYEMNVLLEFARRKIPIQEVEIDTIYINNNATSHFDTIKDSVRIYKEILKFSASSFMSFLIDYVLYSLLLILTSDLRFANIGARIISAAVNYALNYRFVFKSQQNVWKSAMQYFLLATVILLGNTLLLEVFVNTCKINQMAAKVLTEITFFILSWLTQRCIIFKRKEEK